MIRIQDEYATFVGVTTRITMSRIAPPISAIFPWGVLSESSPADASM
jgi:hypothetical protein